MAKLITKEQMAEQESYIMKLKEENMRYAAQNGHAKLALTETYGCQQNEKDYTCQSCHNQLPFSQGEKGTGSAFCIDHQAGNSKEEKKMKDRQKLPAKRPASVSWFL